MAEDSNYTPFKTYRSNTSGNVPSVTKLEEGELAINLADRKIYSKNSDNEIVDLSGGSEHTHTVEEITDIDEVINNIENIISDSVNESSSIPDKFRYWWLTFTAPGISGDTATIAIDQIRLYARGGGFVNGERWSVGNLLEISESAGASLSQDGGSGSLFPLFQAGNSSAWLGSATFNGNPKSMILMIDLGEGNEERITGLEFRVGASDPLSSVTVSASNDNGGSVLDFRNGSYAGTIYELGKWSTAQDDNIPISELTDGDNSPHLAIVASEPTTQVIVDGSEDGARGARTLVPDEVLPLGLASGSGGGGGGDGWTYDFTIKNSSFTAAADTYYFVDVTLIPTVTLPANPPEGTKFGASVVAAGVEGISETGERGALRIALGDSADTYMGDAPDGTGGYLSLPTVYTFFGSENDRPRPQKIELIFLANSIGWVPLHNELVIIDGESS